MDDNIRPQTSDNEVTELKARCEDLENKWKRALADYKNFEKRTQEERVQIFGLAAQNILLEILPVLDNLEMLDGHLNDTGFKLIVKEFKQTLERLGVKEISAQGMDFDANSMEAIELVEGEKNKVVEVLMKGYFLNEKLIRPARVKVGKGKE